MAKLQGRAPRHTKAVNLALQGGGAHGAFTWGVLDYLFEEDRIWVEAISGTSAGAMNAVVAAQGMYDHGAAGAREALEDFWRAVSKAGKSSPIQRSPLDRLMGRWSLDMSPAYLWMDLMNRMTSPYDVNPFGLNPLRDLVQEFVDFEKVRDCEDLLLYLSATNVETGKVRVFHRDEITLDVVMASACLPFLFHAVEIGGVPYWDGGYMGNPAVYPLIYECDSRDVVILHINPLYRPEVPTDAFDIMNRVNEISFNSSLMREMRAIAFVTDMIDKGQIVHRPMKRMLIHAIEAEEAMRELSVHSKLTPAWPFLLELRDIGRSTAESWLAATFDKLGVETSIDLGEVYL